MVDTPEIPNVIPIVRTPQSRVSGYDIAAPFAELANNLNKAGEVSETVAEKYALQAGQEAVSDDGKTIKQPAIPIIGPASAEFARAARFTALSRMTPEIENRIAEIRLQYSNDPKNFQRALATFKNGYLNGDEDKGLLPISDPMLRGPVEHTIMQHGSAAYRSVLDQTDQTNAVNAGIATKSQISDLANRMAQMAFTGKSDTPEYARMQADLKALYGELTDDPRQHYPQARVDSEISELISQNKTMAIAGQAIRMGDAPTPTARADAKKWLIDKIYGDPNLNLTLAQRHQAVTTAMGLMEARSAENKALIDANKTQTHSLLTQLATSSPYNPIVVNDAIENAKKIGDDESMLRLTYGRGMHEWDQTVRGLPTPQQLAAKESLERLNTPFEARLIASESAGNPHLVNTRGYAGLYQFGAPRLADLGLYQPGPKEDLKNWSQSPRDAPEKWSGTFNIPGFPEVKTLDDFRGNPGAQRAAFLAHTQRMDQEITRAGLDKYEGQTIGGVTINREALYGMLHLGGAGGARAALESGGKVASADVYGTSVMDYARKFGQGSAGQAWFDEARIEQIGRFREYMKGQAPDIIDTAIRRMNKTGEISDDDLGHYATLLNEIGRDDLRAKLATAVIAHYGVRELDKLPESTRSALMAQVSPEAAKDNFAFKVGEYMQEQIDANTKAMKVTPYSTWATRAQGMGNPPPQFNFQQPDTIGPVATARAGIQHSFRENDKTGPVSVFEPKEAEAFANVVTNGAPQDAAAAIGGLVNLPSDAYQATLTQKAVADSISGAMSSKDPVRMTAAMQAADKLWRADPAAAEAALGKYGLTKMQAWQGLRGPFNATEIAERLNSADDPSLRKAREDMEKLAEEETAKLSSADMAYKLGSGWWGFGRLSGATPAAPYREDIGRELVNDYRTTYAALRAYGVDASQASDLAAKRLQSTWGISQAAGNQVMKLPPEMSPAYPSIGGSKDWIGEALKGWISRKIGPEFEAGRRTLEAGSGGVAPSRNWEIAGMISDGQTAAEMAGGRAPSYQVAVRDKDGSLKLIEGRVMFDPTSRIEQHTAGLESRRQAIDFLRIGGIEKAGMVP